MIILDEVVNLLDLAMAMFLVDDLSLVPHLFVSPVVVTIRYSIFSYSESIKV